MGIRFWSCFADLGLGFPVLLMVSVGAGSVVAKDIDPSWDYVSPSRCAEANKSCREGDKLCDGYRIEFNWEHRVCPGVNESSSYTPMANAPQYRMNNPNFPNASDTAISPQQQTASQSSVGDEYVSLVKENGILKVPVQINGLITLNFVLDSGAADVQIPEDVARTLMRMKAIVSDDFVGQQTYILANGAAHRESMIRIRSLRVGNLELNNVVASVGDTHGELLLGQSFLKKLKSWSIDNDRNALVLRRRP